MSLSVLNNIPSLVAQNQLQVTNTNLQNTLFQLSSGSRINTGADDAAGLAIVNGLQANISALQQSSANASNGVGKLQVADGALAQVTTLLNRAVTLATESATSTVSQLQRQALNAEFVSIQNEITRIGNATNFNGTQIFSNGTVPNPNQFTTTATSNLTAGSLLTPTDATTVALGAGSSYTYTASATAHTNLNAVIGATATTGATAIANGQGMTVTAGARTYTYLAAGGTGTVTQMIGNINAANAGFSAWLDTNGKVNIVDGEGTNNIVVSANSASGVTGAIANTTTGSTVQDLVNGINASGLGVTAGLAAVTNPNQRRHGGPGIRSFRRQRYLHCGWWQHGGRPHHRHQQFRKWVSRLPQHRRKPRNHGQQLQWEHHRYYQLHDWSHWYGRSRSGNHAIGDHRPQWPGRHQCNQRGCRARVRFGCGWQHQRFLSATGRGRFRDQRFHQRRKRQQYV
jgi:flagellin